MAGTSVQLIIRLPIIELLVVGIMLVLFSGVGALVVQQSTDSVLAPPIPIGIMSFFFLLFTASSGWSVHRAERHFKAELGLTEIAG